MPDSTPFQVCLVQMPYSGLDRPSIALALLKQYLTAANVRSKVVYANIDFADLIGVDVYRTIEETPADSLIGEWTFAQAAFSETRADEAPFLELARTQLQRASWLAILNEIYPHIDAAELISAVRKRATSFVDDMAQKVLALSPRIVGCTSMFQQHCASLALLRRIKELAPEVVTILGGANCEGIMGKTTHEHCTWVDFVASGEADAYFAELCQSILDKGPVLPREQLPEGVLGPADRTRSQRRASARSLPVLGSKPETAVGRAMLQSMDDAAVPDYSDYFDALSACSFRDHVRPFLLFESSRGCWWGQKHHCTFCGLNGDGMRFRSKSAARVLQELGTLRELYGVRWLNAVDNIMDLTYLKTVLPTLATMAEPPHLFYEVKANLKKDQLKLLSAAGVHSIQPGIESLHDDVLKLLKKGNSWSINVQLLKWAQELGVHVLWNFLSGAPGESEEWYWELVEWLPSIYHLSPPGGTLSHIRYDRFSPYHVSAEAHGLQLVPSRAYGHVYPWSREALESFAYFFEDERAAQGPRAPAYSAVAERIRAWHEAHAGSRERPRARLSARDRGDHVDIVDTRPLANTANLTLWGVDYRVWKACDSALSRDELLSTLCGSDETPPTSPTPPEVWASVERLKAARIVLELRGRILSLTVNEPIAPYLEAERGLIAMGKLFKKLAPRSLARGCVRLPSQVPLSQLWAHLA